MIKRIKEKIEKIEESERNIRELKRFLIETFGFRGYVDGCLDDSPDGHFSWGITEEYHKLDSKKLPVKQEEFKLLLDYLGLEIAPENKQKRIIKINDRRNTRRKTKSKKR